jgi:hypothetical protein
VFLKNWNPLELAVESDDDDIPLQLGGWGDRRNLYGMRERERATATTGAAGTDGWTEVLRVDKKKAFDELGE